jgi:hypothetical protein
MRMLSSIATNIQAFPRMAGKFKPWTGSDRGTGFVLITAGFSWRAISAPKNAIIAKPANAHESGKPVCSKRCRVSEFPAITRAMHVNVITTPIQYRPAAHFRLDSDIGGTPQGTSWSVVCILYSFFVICTQVFYEF